MMKKSVIVLALLLIVFGCNKTYEEVNTDKSVEEILQSFVEDFREDPFASEPITFGVRVRGEGGGDWLIVVEGKSEEDKQVPTMLIITSGETHAKIGGVEKLIQKGEMLFIPAGISHEFWNTKEEPCEGIIIMFGKEA